MLPTFITLYYTEIRRAKHYTFLENYIYVLFIDFVKYKLLFK